MPFALRLRRPLRRRAWCRSENQDSGYAGPHLLVVADGMGGHAGGDIASSIVIGALVDLDGEAIGGERRDRPALPHAIAAANDEIAESRGRAQPRAAGHGHHLIAILRSGNKLALAHIGDSRAYLLRDGKLTQITHDHSFVQRLVDEGRITEDEADGHPQRSLVTRVLTGSDGDEPDLIGARGPSRGPLPHLLRRAVRLRRAGHHRGGPPGGQARRATADRLVELALRAGAPDNVTVVVGRRRRPRPGTAPRPRCPRWSAQQRTGARAREPPRRPRLPRRPRCPARRPGPPTTRRSPSPRRRPARTRRGGCAVGPDRPARPRRPRRRRVCRVRLDPAPVLRRVRTRATSRSTRGVSQDLGPITLSHVEEVSDGPDGRTCPTSTATASRTPVRQRPSPTPRASSTPAHRGHAVRLAQGRWRQLRRRCRRARGHARRARRARPRRHVQPPSADFLRQADGHAMTTVSTLPPATAATSSWCCCCWPSASSCWPTSTSASPCQGSFPPGLLAHGTGLLVHLPRLPPAAALAGVLRGPPAAADRHPAQRPGPGDDPPARHRQGQQRQRGPGPQAAHLERAGRRDRRSRAVLPARPPCPAALHLHRRRRSASAC